MNPSETLSPSPSYIGHVRNGIVVLDADASFIEGQAVRVEPLQVPSTEAGGMDSELAARVQKIRTIFEQWTQEDSHVSPEVAEEFHLALEANRGLEFQTPDLT